MLPQAVIESMSREELVNLITSLATDTSYGVLTSNAGAFLLQHIDTSKTYDLVFFDLAGLHSVNAALGYAGSNKVFGTPLALHRTSDMLVSLKFSGDEFMAVLPAGTGRGYCERLIVGWQDQYNNLSTEDKQELQNPTNNDLRVRPIHEFTASFGIMESVSGEQVSMSTFDTISTAIEPIKATGQRGFIHIVE